MFLIVTYSKDKINLILYAASVSIVLTSESQTPSWRCLSRRASGFEENDFYPVIIRSFLGGRLTCVLAASFCCQYIGVLVGAFSSLILIYRHGTKSVCKYLNSHGDLLICRSS